MHVQCPQACRANPLHTQVSFSKLACHAGRDVTSIAASVNGHALRMAKSQLESPCNGEMYSAERTEQLRLVCPSSTIHAKMQSLSCNSNGALLTTLGVWTEHQHG